jgi:hypothetical protein
LPELVSVYRIMKIRLSEDDIAAAKPSELPSILTLLTKLLSAVKARMGLPSKPDAPEVKLPEPNRNLDAARKARIDRADRRFWRESWVHDGSLKSVRRIGIKR